MATKTPSRKPKATPRTGAAKTVGRQAPTKPASTARRAPSPKRTARVPRAVAAPPVAPSPPTPAASKQSQLIALLSSAPGASIVQMTKLTGWQPHTVRGTISGVLRKKLGLDVACTAGESGVRVYRIVASA